MSQCRILVVDDEIEILDQFRSVLDPDQCDESLSQKDRLESELFGSEQSQPHELSYDVTFCRQGDEAVKAVSDAIAQKRPFSLAFVDVRMPPGPDGVTSAEQMRAIDSDINIVMLTAFADVDPGEIARRVGPIEKLLYVQKPFFPQEIRHFAAALCSKWQSEQELNAKNAQLARVIKNLIAANKALNEADQLKTEFLKAMSHELRTPLTIFKNVISNAISGVFGELSQKLKANLQMADDGLKRLSRMFADFLEISMLETGELKPIKTDISIQKYLDEVSRKYITQCSEKNIDLRISSEDLCISFDSNMFKRVVNNLLENAVRFAGTGGSISLRTCQIDGAVEIRIEDSGPGIEPNDIERIFCKFVQIQRDVGPGWHGTGLGLSIAKRIVELHGGKIWVESAGGRGSNFCFLVPVKTAPATKTQPKDQMPQQVSPYELY